jgi:hypothetical protein
MIEKYNFKNFINLKDQDNCINLIDNLFQTDNWHKESPNFQTYSNLFYYEELFKFKTSFLFSCFMYLNKNLTIKEIKCWCYMNHRDNYKRQDRENLWHSHLPYNLSGLYYLRNPNKFFGKHSSSSGTEFLDSDIKNIIPEDFCWFIYPSNLVHRPGLIKSNKRRYVLAADVLFE